MITEQSVAERSGLNTKGPAEPTSTVVADIIRDAQELLSQQLALFREEVREDFRKTREAVYPMTFGLGLAAIGGVLLCLMLVYLLHWAYPALPLWGAYGIVAAVLTLLGVGLFLVGKSRLESFNPLPDKTAEALKENLQWLKQPK